MALLARCCPELKVQYVYFVFVYKIIDWTIMRFYLGHLCILENFNNSWKILGNVLTVFLILVCSLSSISPSRFCIFRFLSRVSCLKTTYENLLKTTDNAGLSNLLRDAIGQLNSPP